MSTTYCHHAQLIPGQSVPTQPDAAAMGMLVAHGMGTRAPATGPCTPHAPYTCTAPGEVLLQSGGSQMCGKGERMMEAGMLSIVRRGDTYQVRYASTNPYDMDRPPSRLPR